MKKKLIEVALPLDAINKESAREKSIRHGHPSTLHLWWARRPLAACRAVLFAQMVDDPSSHPELFPTEEDQNTERERLFDLIRELVKWENINNEKVLEQARAEIRKSAPSEGLPPVLDPFAGGGSIPLEAQRLGLEAHASDLNPVAVIINKALIEIPPRFASKPPIHPDQEKRLLRKHWFGVEGLVEDVRYYGRWMRAEAEKRIGSMYPDVIVSEETIARHREIVGKGLVAGVKLKVIAWLWARTANCPNPACGVEMPLLGSLWLSRRKGRQTWLKPIVDPSETTHSIHFEVVSGEGHPQDPPKIGRGARFRCIACGQIADEVHIREEFRAKRAGYTLTAIVANSPAGRIYLDASELQTMSSNPKLDSWSPDEEMDQRSPNLVSGRGYGITHWQEIYTERQLVLLSTYCDLVKEVRNKIIEDSHDSTRRQSRTPDYADAVTTYLGLAVSKTADYNSSFVVWSPSRDQVKSTFARQALPMVWDFGEVNPFAGAAGDYKVTIEGICRALERSAPAIGLGKVVQKNATTDSMTPGSCISTDPPYYDNIAYADLADFFYIWLRHSLEEVYPELFRTLLVPKSDELIAAPYRLGGSAGRARDFFEGGLRASFDLMYSNATSEYPLTVSVDRNGNDAQYTGNLKPFCQNGPYMGPR